MQTLIGDAEALSQAASACRQAGDEIRSLSSRFASATSSPSWVGPRADRFRQDMTGQNRQLVSVADTLESVASRFASLASQVTDQMGVIGRIEQTVRDFIQQQLKDAESVGLWVGMAWSPDHLPEPYDPAWLDIAKHLDLSI